MSDQPLKRLQIRFRNLESRITRRSVKSAEIRMGLENLIKIRIEYMGTVEGKEASKGPEISTWLQSSPRRK